MRRPERESEFAGCDTSECDGVRRREKLKPRYEILDSSDVTESQNPPSEVSPLPRLQPWAFSVYSYDWIDRGPSAGGSGAVTVCARTGRRVA
jgi:hypothetical protein